MADPQNAIKRRALREAALFFGLLFVGVVLMPIAIYLVGQQFFGDYGGNGFGEFFGTLSGKVRSGDSVAWFLVLSPYLTWQILRLAVRGWSRASKVPD